MSDLIGRLENPPIGRNDDDEWFRFNETDALIKEAAARIKELEAAAKAPLPEEVAGLIKRLRSIDRRIRAWIWVETAAALERQARELHEADNSHAKTLVEFGKLRIRNAELEAEIERLESFSDCTPWHVERIKELEAELAHARSCAVNSSESAFAFKAERDQVREAGKLMQENIHRMMQETICRIEADRDSLKTCVDWRRKQVEVLTTELAAIEAATIERCMDVLDIHGERRKATIRALAKPTEKEEK